MDLLAQIAGFTAANDRLQKENEAAKERYQILTTELESLHFQLRVTKASHKQLEKEATWRQRDVGQHVERQDTETEEDFQKHHQSIYNK